MFTKSTFLAIALSVTMICSATAPAAAYLSLTPRTEAQESVIASEISAVSKAAEVKAPDAARQVKSTDVVEFDDTSAPDPVVSGPAVASVMANSL